MLQRLQGVSDLLECAKHGLAIIGLRLLIGVDGGPPAVPQTGALKYGIVADGPMLQNLPLAAVSD